MALTKNASPVYEIGDIGEAPLTASAKVYLGAALGYTGNNTVRPLVAADKFAGFAIDSADQAAGDINVRFKDRGSIVLTVATLAANTPVGTSVYASDDATFTLVATSNSLIGKIRRLVSSTKAAVEFLAPVV
jgi:hypothetical protein